MKQADESSVLRKLLTSRYVGVLSTVSVQGQPYPNLVAYAFADDLSQLVFATPKATRKYANLRNSNRVAMLIDNRTNDITDIREAAAATAIGSARELTSTEREPWIGQYVRRHPHLDAFVRADSTAFFCMYVEKYILVTRFQDVVEIDL